MVEYVLGKDETQVRFLLGAPDCDDASIGRVFLMVGLGFGWSDFDKYRTFWQKALDSLPRIKSDYCHIVLTLF